MAIKHIHRIPVEEKFIEPLGEAICVCQYLDDTLRCIGRRLNTDFYSQTLKRSSGLLVKELKTTISTCDIAEAFRGELLELCEKSRLLFLERNKVVHSHGYTKPNGDQGRVHQVAGHGNTYIELDFIIKFVENASSLACEANNYLHDVRITSS